MVKYPTILHEFLTACTAFCFSAQTLLAADYTVEMHTSTSQADTQKSETQKQVLYMTNTSLRNDEFRNDKLVSTTVLGNASSFTCSYINPSTPKCSPLDSKNTNASSAAGSNSPKRLHKAKQSEDSFFNFKYWKVTRLNRTGTFAGLTCNYFRREYLMSSAIGQTTTETKNLEDFCVDQIYIRNNFLTIVSQIPAALAGKKSAQVLAEEAKAKGFVLFSDAKISVTSKMQPDKRQTKPSWPLANNSQAGSMKDLQKIAAKLQNFSSATRVIKTATKVSNGPLSSALFLMPKGALK